MCVHACRGSTAAHAACRIGHARLQARHVLVFAHVPPFILQQDEPDGYFNLRSAVRYEASTSTATTS